MAAERSQPRRPAGAPSVPLSTSGRGGRWPGRGPLSGPRGEAEVRPGGRNFGQLRGSARPRRAPLLPLGVRAPLLLPLGPAGLRAAGAVCSPAGAAPRPGLWGMNEPERRGAGARGTRGGCPRVRGPHLRPAEAGTPRRCALALGIGAPRARRDAERGGRRARGCLQTKESPPPPALRRPRSRAPRFPYLRGARVGRRRLRSRGVHAAGRRGGPGGKAGRAADRPLRLSAQPGVGAGGVWGRRARSHPGAGGLRSGAGRGGSGLGCGSGAAGRALVESSWAGGGETGRAGEGPGVPASTPLHFPCSGAEDSGVTPSAPGTWSLDPEASPPLRAKR